MGNDFIPHLAGCDIRNGSLDLVFECYITFLKVWGTTITTEKGDINPDNFHNFMQYVAAHEKDIVAAQGKLNRNNIYKNHRQKRNATEKDRYKDKDLSKVDVHVLQTTEVDREDLNKLFPLCNFDRTSMPWFNGLDFKSMQRYLDFTMYE